MGSGRRGNGALDHQHLEWLVIRHRLQGLVNGIKEIGQVSLTILTVGSTHAIVDAVARCNGFRNIFTRDGQEVVSQMSLQSPVEPWFQKRQLSALDGAESLSIDFNAIDSMSILCKSEACG